jgi:sugar/nucleoside kinase (ribokinase family)
MGEKGLFWYDETSSVRQLPALPISRDRVLDTNGAGDVFHGAYVYSYLAHPGKTWQEHFEFARAASTYKIQRLGNEAESAEAGRHRRRSSRSSRSGHSNVMQD